ncbi:methyltransferase domain-containing protein [Flavobacterium cellulosilyticum]|uniref:Methyltransferase domain-containing protein n=1 Tax=Flavobacterium cellulosilyticum TaxID=2541731 RepID=A0A4R5C8C9_9FLAO|nr:methyltransferase domain-containing protein [Flavobacterium cellulosilyticum]TDD94876.1 methyltransferase domain-containing protein [Flavobacterium cellulosilyticum]
MILDIKNRSDDSEIMDDFTMEGEILREALDKIAKINQLLGGNQLTLQGVKELITAIPAQKEILIVDLGCGNGDMLRTLDKYGRENNLNFRLIGIDANNFTINHARKLSENHPNISYRCEDIFDKSFHELKYDISLCTLTLHHFKNEEIEEILTVLNKNSNFGIVINDLHRSALAYRIFQGLCFVFRLNEMSRLDGLVSIKRGFKKEELILFSNKLKLTNYKIQWKWAFRYQWIVKKDKEIIDF